MLVGREHALSKNRNKWNCPGGKPDASDGDAWDTAKREYMEEIGHDCDELELVAREEVQGITIFLMRGDTGVGAQGRKPSNTSMNEVHFHLIDGVGTLESDGGIAFVLKRSLAHMEREIRKVAAQAEHAGNDGTYDIRDLFSTAGRTATSPPPPGSPLLAPPSPPPPPPLPPQPPN